MPITIDMDELDDGIISLRPGNKPRKDASPASEQNLSKQEIEQKIMECRPYGFLEIEKFREIVKKAKEDIDKLSIFKTVGDTLYEVAIHEILEETIEPVFKGRRPSGMPEDLYKEYRRQMYKELIRQYATSQDDK